MNRYIAFLRAINVGGHTVKMEVLRRLFEDAGLADVETFIASGNIIFSSGVRKPESLEKIIEVQLQAALGYEVVTFIRSAEELAAVAAHEPYPASEFSAGATLYISFLKRPPDAETVRSTQALGNAIHEFHFHARELYWLRRRQLGDEVYSGPVIERSLRGPVTMRNASTVRKLAEKYKPLHPGKK